MPSENIPVEFDDVIGDGGGKYECPICHEFRSDSVRSVKGHISGSRDDLHVDLGWNYEEEIRETSSK